LRCPRPTVVVILATLVWGGLFAWSLEQYRGIENATGLTYQAFDFGKAMTLTGFGLLVLWIGLAIRKRSLRMGAFVFGLFVAFFFCYCADLENVGWHVAEYYASNAMDHGGGVEIALNPFLHVGGGHIFTHAGGFVPDYAYQSSLAPLNMLVYFIYGESIAFLLLFAAMRLSRLAGHWRLALNSRSRTGSNEDSL